MIPFSLSILITLVMSLLSMAFFTLMERKILGYIQLRKGPNKVMITGIPQPFADAMKLFLKESTKPSMINKMVFIMAPAMTLTFALLFWTLFPHTYPSMLLSFGMLYFLCVSSINVYTVFMSGWSSNSKYTMIGAIRSVAQTISYEVSMAIILLSALILFNSMNSLSLNTESNTWPAILLLPLMMMWFTTMLAETNRTPFDLAEGESELVSGFNTEYSGALFALIFMAEYMNILFMSLISATMFMPGTLMFIPKNIWLIIKLMVFSTLFIWLRGTMPRMRYDKLMFLTWKIFLPSSLLFMMILIMYMTLLKWYCAGWTDNSDDVNYELLFQYL